MTNDENDKQTTGGFPPVVFLCAPGTGANSAVQVRYTLGSEEC